MQIIKPGKHMNGEWTHEFTCTAKGNGNQGCEAVLEITASDLYATQSHARDETTNYITFMCPCCGAETDLYHDEGYRHPEFPHEMTRRSPPSASSGKRRKAQASIKAGKYIPPHQI